LGDKPDVSLVPRVDSVLCDLQRPAEVSSAATERFPIIQIGVLNISDDTEREERGSPLCDLEICDFDWVVEIRVLATATRS